MTDTDVLLCNALAIKLAIPVTVLVVEREMYVTVAAAAVVVALQVPVKSFTRCGQSLSVAQSMVAFCTTKRE